MAGHSSEMPLAPSTVRAVRQISSAARVLLSAVPEAAAPHEVEPFGPAATVPAYRDTGHAADPPARGRGSLAASAGSDAAAWTSAFLGETAVWHGRLHLLDSLTMGQTTGHGSLLPAPAALWAGPGRWRVGDGGCQRRRGPEQRTAVQGAAGAGLAGGV